LTKLMSSFDSSAMLMNNLHPVRSSLRCGAVPAQEFDRGENGLEWLLCSRTPSVPKMGREDASSWCHGPAVFLFLTEAYALAAHLRLT
jgi:hypothetical protein